MKMNLIGKMVILLVLLFTLNEISAKSFSAWDANRGGIVLSNLTGRYGFDDFKSGYIFPSWTITIRHGQKLGCYVHLSHISVSGGSANYAVTYEDIEDHGCDKITFIQLPGYRNCNYAESPGQERDGDARCVSFFNNPALMHPRLVVEE